MAKCKFPNCKNKILSVSLSCNGCKKMYCGKHRLPEDHLCENLSNLRETKKLENEKKLLNEKCVLNVLQT